MATITFDKSNKYIQLGVGDVVATVQELADAIRVYEADLNNLDLPQMMIATGKDTIGGGDLTAITLELQDGWHVRADDTFGSPTIVRITQGNLLSSDGLTPFITVTNVSYDRGFSTAPGLANVPTVSGSGRTLNV